MYNKTKSLEFKNFRKFADFPAIEFNDITFLVGANNSGKSTFVKAVMLVYNYLQQRDLRTVDFNANGVDILNIVSYERALHKSNAVNKPEEIQIGATIHDYKFDIKLKSHKENSKATVLDFKCSYWGTSSLQIDPVARTIRIEEAPSRVLATFGDEKEDAAREELSKLNDELASIENPFSIEYIEIKAAIDKLSESLEVGKEITGWSVEVEYHSDDILEVLTGLTNLIATMPMLHAPESDSILGKNIDGEEEEEEEEEDNELIDDENSFNSIDQTFHYDSDRDNWIVRLKMEQKKITDIQSLYTARNGVMQFLTDLKDVVTTSEIVYLPATLNKQSALFFVRDEKNALAQTIHTYYQNKNVNDFEPETFIKNWLRELNIGDDIKIELIEDEAYKVDIIKDGLSISLADKGMGAIQGTLLILRLASLIRKHKRDEEKLEVNDISDKKNYIVVLEEPELNLHPALQSKLCDLFYHVYKKYQIEFIIETHSEYMIRKTQLHVKTDELMVWPNQNVFSVIYFDEIEGSYPMEYREDGKFKNEFGTGFFDESTNLAFELL